MYIANNVFGNVGTLVTLHYILLSTWRLQHAASQLGQAEAQTGTQAYIISIYSSSTSYKASARQNSIHKADDMYSSYEQTLYIVYTPPTAFLN